MSFRARFRGQGHSYLADVVDGPAGDDWTLRPSQVFALSFPFPLLDSDEAREVLDAVGDRSSPAMDSARCPRMTPPIEGIPGRSGQARWFLSPRAVLEFVVRPVCRSDISFDRDRDASQALLRPIGDHLRDAGRGWSPRSSRRTLRTPAQRVHCPGLGRCGSTEGLANARPGKATNGSIRRSPEYGRARSMAKGNVLPWPLSCVSG